MRSTAPVAPSCGQLASANVRPCARAAAKPPMRPTSRGRSSVVRSRGGSQRTAASVRSTQCRQRAPQTPGPARLPGVAAFASGRTYGRLLLEQRDRRQPVAASLSSSSVLMLVIEHPDERIEADRDRGEQQNVDPPFAATQRPRRRMVAGDACPRGAAERCRPVCDAAGTVAASRLVIVHPSLAQARAAAASAPARSRTGSTPARSRSPCGKTETPA